MDISKILGAGGGNGAGYMANAMGGLGGLGGVAGGPKLGGGLPPMQRGGQQPGPAPNGFIGLAAPSGGMQIEDVFGRGTMPSLAYKMGGMSALSPFHQQIAQQKMDQAAPQPPTGMPNPNMTAPFFSAAQGAGRPMGGFFSRMGR